MSSLRFIALIAGIVLPCSIKAAGLTATIPYDFEAHGLADFRYLHADSRQSWIDQGLGKFRYGAADNGNDLFRVDKAALVMQARLNWDWTGIVTAKYSNRQKNPVDISEAVLLFRPVSTSAWRLNARLGAFMPPISLENSGTAWSSPYTLTNSAINSWVGEELKTFGGEAQLSYQFASGDKVNLFGAGFGNNDTAGTLLAWRGWSMHDYVATVNDRLPLTTRANIFQLFPRQALQTQPFIEVDSRPGYYAGISLERPELIKLRALYYDNRARTNAIDHGQYGWHTRFWSLGAKMDLPWQTTLIGQGMLGRTQMGRQTRGLFPVDSGFWAESILLSKAIGSHRLSVRHDRFGTTEHDLSVRPINIEPEYAEAANIEQGYAWTLNYNVTLIEHHQLNFEVSTIYSDRKTRLLLDEATGQRET
ncbi:MAG: hypothetical protein PHU14_14710, partial [Methylovulum sp.]|nr:hypothetical protein [Methylovulum sp.]